MLDMPLRYFQGSHMAANLSISPSVANFLDLVAWSELGKDLGPDNGYGVIVTGVDGPNSFTDYSDHPFAPPFHREPIQFAWPDSPEHRSTASGRYQIIYPTWVRLKSKLSLKDFSPPNQDLAGQELLRERGAIPLIEAGDIQGAIAAVHGEWESFPDGVVQGDGPHSMDALLDQYQIIAAGPDDALQVFDS